MTPLPAPPTRIGGCGRCAGLGQDQMGPKSTWRPWNSASSCVQIARIACTRSSMPAQRVGGSRPWLAISSGIHPTQGDEPGAARLDSNRERTVVGWPLAHVTQIRTATPANCGNAHAPHASLNACRCRELPPRTPLTDRRPKTVMSRFDPGPVIPSHAGERERERERERGAPRKRPQPGSCFRRGQRRSPCIRLHPPVVLRACCMTRQARTGHAPPPADAA